MLVELATVKQRLGIEAADVADDAILTAIILGVSNRFDSHCLRKFARLAGATEEFQADETEIRVERYPIESVSAFHLKTTEADGWEEQTGLDYLIRRKCVISLPAMLGTYRQQAQVTYTGGYVLPGTTVETGQTALPAEISTAAMEQVAHWYQNKNRLGVTAITGEGGSVTQFAKLDLLPSVEATLQPYKRFLA